MDARERLRRYLEQRREMGESELVLDSLTVEEAMRIVGGAAPQDTSRSGGSANGTTPDWREMLRAAGGVPGATEHAQPGQRNAKGDQPRQTPRAEPPG
ncbi:MAG: hypothetical protein M3282_06525, partial [Gemmatimonadota bacterium]|nr:hypothetical protein [Gemmatimonadota bacterium]